MKTTRLVHVGWFSLVRRNNTKVLVLKMTTNTLAEDVALSPRHNNQAVLFLKRQIASRPLGYEHNEQTIDTNGWSYCPLQSVWAHLSHKVRSSELWEGFRRGATLPSCAKDPSALGPASY